MSHYPKPKETTINTKIAAPVRSAIRDPAVWVQLVRASQGWTQEELAEAAGIHPAQISAYENRRKTPSPATRAKLAAAAGTTPEAVDEAFEVIRGRRKGTPGASISERAASMGEQTRRAAEASLRRAAALFAAR